MVLYLKMDQKTWGQLDYTDSATYDLSGTVYDENTFATTRDISSFTGTFRLINQSGDVAFSTNQNLTLNSDGTFLVKFAEGATPHLSGSYKVRLRLEVSGTRITAIGVNGSDNLFLEYD